MKKTLQLLSLLVLLSFGQKASAQAFDSFYDRNWDFHLVQSVPGYFGVGFQVASGREGMFKRAFEYQNLLLEDLPPALIHLLSTGTDKDKERISNLLGSLAFGLNVWSKNKLTVAAGINVSDYYVFHIPVPAIYSQYSADGEYVTGGSFLRADYAFNDKIMLRVRNYVSQSFQNNGDKNIKPIFIKTGIEAVSGKGLFIGAEYVLMTKFLDTQRGSLNLRLGYKFEKN